MASLMNSLYPPKLDSLMDSFIRNEACKIYFDISEYNSKDEIGGVQVIAYQQDNSQYALNQSLYPGHVMWVPDTYIKFDNTKQLYYIDLSWKIFQFASENEKGGFPINTYFRVQLRFTDTNFKGMESLAPAVEGEETTYGYTLTPQQLIDYQSCFSEWSTATLIRGINRPIIKLSDTNNIEVHNNVVNYRMAVTDISAKLVWYDPIEMKESTDNNNYETLQEYSIQVYLCHQSYDTLLVESGTLYPSEIDASKEQIYWKIPYNFSTGATYKIVINYTTSGNYSVKNVTLDRFTILEDEEDDELEFDKIRTTVNNEEGYILLNLRGTFRGNLVVRRSSSESDFTIWEDIKYLPYSSIDNQINWFYRDYTVKSGVFYKYGVQRIETTGLRGKLYEVGEKDQTFTLMPDFEHMHLVSGDRQLNIKFNREVNDFKRVVKESVTDTLGSQYPYIRRNANTNYRQFNITGLISYQADEKHLLVTADELHRMVGAMDYKNEVYMPDMSSCYLLANSLIDEHEEKYRNEDLDDKYWRNEIPTLDSKSSGDCKIIYKDGSSVVNEISEIYPEQTANSDICSNSLLGTEAIKYKSSTLRAMRSKIAASYQKYNEEHNINELYDVNLEREFREAVMDFLYNDKIKLFKSAEEGNILVKLTDISFSPNHELGGRVYSFSATATEIADFSFDNCLKYGITSLGALYSPISEYENHFGAINGSYDANTNLLSAIRNKECYQEYDSHSIKQKSIDDLSWFRLGFLSEPYWIDSNFKAHDEPMADAFYGYAFKLSYNTMNGEMEQVILVSPNGSFETEDTNSKDEVESNVIYEDNIYNTYINGVSLYDMALNELESQSNLSMDSKQEEAIILAEQYLESLNLNADMSITAITLLHNDTVSLEYYCRLYSNTTRNMVTRKVVYSDFYQIHGTYNYEYDLIQEIVERNESRNVENDILKNETTVTSIDDIIIQAEPGTVFYIKDIYADRYIGNDDVGYRHEIGRNGYLALSGTNSEGTQTHFDSIVVKGKHFFYAPSMESIKNKLARKDAYDEDIAPALDSDLDVERIKIYRGQDLFQASALQYDNSYCYDATNRTYSSTAAVLALPNYHDFYVYKVGNKYYMGINKTLYECVFSDGENIESGVDVIMPVDCILNCIVNKETTYYLNLLEEGR